MRKTTTKLLLSGIAGAVLGAVIIILGLSLIGANSNLPAEKKEISKNVASSVAPFVSPSVQINSSSPSSVGQPVADKKTDATVQVFQKGKFGYSIPDGYRLAGAIMTLDEKNAPKGSAILTLTKGTTQQENEYVKLIEQLQGASSGTEAPQFLPGQTITVSIASVNLQEADAKLAHEQTKIETAAGITGVRYIKVEGATPYDITYLKLADGRLVSVQMSYGSSEPLFDEKAYLAVVNSVMGK